MLLHLLTDSVQHVSRGEDSIVMGLSFIAIVLKLDSRPGLDVRPCVAAAARPPRISNRADSRWIGTLYRDGLDLEYAGVW